MTEKNMTLRELEKNIDLYSADLSLWPQGLVRPALALVEKDADAKALFDKALELDALLRQWQPPHMTAARMAGLEEKIVRAALSQGRAVAVKAGASLSAYLGRAGGGLVAMALLGFIIGITPSPAGADWVLDPVFYAQDQIIGGDIAASEEGLF